jgi:hypothetical protein
MMQDTKANLLLPRLATVVSICGLGFAAMSVGMLFAPIDAHSYHMSSRVAVESRDATPSCATTPCANASGRYVVGKIETDADEQWPVAASDTAMSYDDDERPEYRKAIRNSDFGPDNIRGQDETKPAPDVNLSLRVPRN